MLAIALKTLKRRDSWADSIGMGLAGLCLLHCIGTTILVAFLASAGGLFFDHHIHEIGLLLAIGIGIIGLGQGLRRHRLIMPLVIGLVGIGLMAFALSLPHGMMEIFFTMVGVTILATGHFLNFRAVH